MQYQDTTVVPADTMLWFCSTLLKVDGRWQLEEDSQDVTLLDRMDEPVLCLEATEVLTLAHNFRPRHGGQLGFYEDGADEMFEDFVAGVPVEVPGVRAGLSQEVDVANEHGVPAAQGEAEDPPAERDPEMDSFSVMVQGVTLDSTTSLRIIRAACKNLGLSSNGSKMKCLKRLHQHIQAQELLAQQGATASLEDEISREPLAPAVPQVPTDEQRMKHYLTHQPYAPWCEFCISNRAREDVHQSVTPSSAGSVVSFDFGYVSRLEDEKDKLTVLFAHDQHTKMMHSVPTQQKGGRSSVYLCTELVRFVLHLGHQAVILRCDDEPSTVALANSTRKSLRSFGVSCKLEFVTVGNHQGNGAAEVTVQVIRQLGMCFLQRLEAGGGLDKPVFGAHHPLTAWCLIHASWIHNRYATTSGQTAYERAFDSPYQGRICQFGEVVLAYVKSTKKFVRSWRQKERRGARCWLRRSRYVAREFAWLTPEREDVFSPASSAVVSRLLPYCYLKRAAREEKTQAMMSLDVGDAFLTVKQETPTVVTCVDATGRKQEFGLGRVLPGQRDGALLWYRDITGLLKGKLDMEEMSACPCLLRAPNCQALIRLHVDDLLVVGDYSFIELQLLPVLKGKYKLSMELMKEPGDEVTFLKRNHVLLSKTEMVIYPHEKHFHKLFDLLKIKRSWKPKNVPSHTMINEIDSSAELGSQQASTFRSAVGVLLYMASDLVECQFTIRHLARCMATPTARGFEILKHLVCYLLGRSEFGLLLNLEQFKYDERMKLLAYSDSDWAGHHGSRKSASSGCLMIDGILLYSSSRTQGLIALSSAEAEVYAAVSTCCDAIYMKRCLEFVFEQNVSIQLLIDNSAARQILMRAGVGRVRHLSVKILWLQQQVERKMVSVAAVA